VTTPANGARTTVLSTPISASCQRVLRHLHVALRGGDARGQCVALGLTAWSYCRLRDQLLRHQFVAGGTGSFSARSSWVRASSSWLRAASNCECRERALGFDIDRIETRQDLAGLDAHAFLDQHFGHLAGDLGRDRGHGAAR
jgi:hypothetical protein